MNGMRWIWKRLGSALLAAALAVGIGACDEDIPVLLAQITDVSNLVITNNGDTVTFGSTDISWTPRADGTYEIRIGSACDTGTVSSGANATGMATKDTPIVSTIDASDVALSEGDNTVLVCLTLNTTALRAAKTTITLDDTAPAAPGSFVLTPTGPANNNGPGLDGMTDAGAEVEVFDDAACTSSIGMAMADAAGDFTATLAVGDDTVSDLYALSRDAVGNESACTDTTLTYTEDSMPPGGPTLTGTTPASPANDNNPSIEGTTEAGAAVEVFTDAGCTTSAGTGTADGGGDFSIAVTVSDNTTTTFYAIATDAIGNATACSVSNVTYIEDSMAPDAPNISGTTPSSPSNENDPTIDGTAEADATVRIYNSNSCGGAIQNTGTATGGNFNVSVTLPDDTTRTYTATAVDAAGNVSGCSNATTYQEDSMAPSPPTFSSTSPASPNTDTMPEIIGTAESGSTVRLYTNNTCTSAVAATGMAGAFGGAGLTVTVGADTSTTFYGTAMDMAGNTSDCSTSNITYTTNNPPVFTNLPTTVSCDLGEAVNFTAMATDTDSLTFSQGGGSTCAQTSQSVASNGNVTFTCTAISTDTCTILVRVSDGINPGVNASLTVNPEDVWFVDGTVGASGNGRTWATAMKTVQEASDAASSGDSVWVAMGTYKASSGGGYVLTAKDGVSYYGGFDGTETQFDERSVSGNVTILDGDFGGDGPDADNSSSVVLIAGQSNVRIDGFVIQNGAGGTQGGGVYILAASNTVIANSTIQNNSSVSVGGGIYNAGANSVLTDLVFDSNSVSASGGGNSWGGALYMASGSGYVANSTFLNNTASRTSGGVDGGAIFFSGGTAAVVNSVFDGNSIAAGGVFGRGGAISSEATTLYVTNCSFYNNSQNTNAGLVNGAGAISANINAGENVIIENSVFWGNTSAEGNNNLEIDAGDAINHSCIEGGFAGTGNATLTADPFNVVGNSYFLNTTAGGGVLCTDNGSNTAADNVSTGYGLTGFDWRDLTTRSDGMTETDVDGSGTETVDAGVHYEP